MNLFIFHKPLLSIQFLSMNLIRLHYLKDNKISILWGDDSEIKSIVEDGMDSVASPSNLKWN